MEKMIKVYKNLIKISGFALLFFCFYLKILVITTLERSRKALTA